MNKNSFTAKRSFLVQCFLGEIRFSKTSKLQYLVPFTLIFPAAINQYSFHLFSMKLRLINLTFGKEMFVKLNCKMKKLQVNSAAFTYLEKKPSWFDGVMQMEVTDTEFAAQTSEDTNYFNPC